MSALRIWDGQIKPTWRWLEGGVSQFEQNCRVHAPSEVDAATLTWRNEMLPALRNAEKLVDDLRATGP